MSGIPPQKTPLFEVLSISQGDGNPASDALTFFNSFNIPEGNLGISLLSEPKFKKKND